MSGLPERARRSKSNLLGRMKTTTRTEQLRWMREARGASLLEVPYGQVRVKVS